MASLCLPLFQSASPSFITPSPNSSDSVWLYTSRTGGRLPHRSSSFLLPPASGYALPGRLAYRGTSPCLCPRLLQRRVSSPLHHFTSAAPSGSIHAHFSSLHHHPGRTPPPSPPDGGVPARPFLCWCSSGGSLIVLGDLAPRGGSSPSCRAVLHPDCRSSLSNFRIAGTCG